MYLLNACIALCFATLAQGKADDYYYWRDYIGIIPDDAFHAGHNTYIAQIAHNNALIPAHLDGTTRIAEYPFLGERYTTNKNFKVFCTKNSNSFKWLSTNNDLLRFLITDELFVRGGYDDDYPLLVGKLNGRVGKITIRDWYPGLGYTSHESAKRSTSFEVLAIRHCTGC